MIQCERHLQLDENTVSEAFLRLEKLRNTADFICFYKCVRCVNKENDATHLNGEQLLSI